MSGSVGIVDYGVGNIGSLMAAFEAAGQTPELIDDPAKVGDCERLILPGVGSMAYCHEQLENFGFVGAIESFRESGRPLLGICVGMQLFMDEGSETRQTSGFGFIPGKVLPIETDLPVPHIGFNQLSTEGIAPRDRPDDLAAEGYFYFLHSFHCEPVDDSTIMARVSYGARNYVAILQQENLFGVQFHPEVSGAAGIALLRNFLRVDASNAS